MGSTERDKKLAAEYLRTKASGAVLQDTADALNRVASELDPPAPRTVTIAGMKFRYESNGDWMRFVESGVPYWLRSASLGYVLSGLTLTPEEYATVYALQEGK